MQAEATSALSKINNAARSTPSAKVVAEPASAAQPGKGCLNLDLNGRHYQARWAQAGTVEHLRVNLRIESGSNGSTRMHIETLDLYSPRSRSVFAARAAHMLGADAGAIDCDLSTLLVAIDKAQRSAAAVQASKPDEEAPPVMSDTERQEALALLRDPDLMERITRDMDAIGYVGEEANKQLGYLIAVSRKLPEPLSAIIISQSGAGKSGLASAIEKLVPPEEVVFWSRLTPQALYYVEKDFLKRKLVVIEEREGSDAADYSIRALQSKHKLVQAVPVKDPATGNIRTRTMEVEGPSAFFETTTRPTINPENASRCFELYLDESQAQTQRVQAAQRSAKTSLGLLHRKKARAIERMHQNAQRLLESVPVVIPYAELLTFPASWLRTRRDNLRMLNLIEAVAFLHQFQRPRKLGESGEDQIEATVDDYAVAYSLAVSVLGFGLDELRKPVRDLLNTIDAKVQESAHKQGTRPQAVRFTRRDVRAWTGLPNHQVKISMRELEEMEYLEVEKAARGSRFSYRLAHGPDQGGALVSGLLTPVELFNRIASPTSRAARTTRSAATSSKVEQSGKRHRSTHFLASKA